MLKVLGRATSSNVQKVTWTLEELGVPYDREDIGGAFGGLDTPEYIAMNPNKVIPTVID
ncbi:MAG: glutathione S-transferase, partial [Rhodospirillaceae bacterium]|nr:glutathione S-transferase [Rhodospirillaceae bacterium]